DEGSTSRLSVLRFDPSGGPGDLDAEIEWDLTSTLAGEGVSPSANGGLEAITFISDADAVTLGVVDEASDATYDPSALAAHLGGLVVVGVEDTGDLFVFSLFESGTYSLVARIDPGLGHVMSLEFDDDTGRLWAGCDDSCDNQLAVLAVDQS